MKQLMHLSFLFSKGTLNIWEKMGKNQLPHCGDIANSSLLIPLRRVAGDNLPVAELARVPVGPKPELWRVPLQVSFPTPLALEISKKKGRTIMVILIRERRKCT